MPKSTFISAGSNTNVKSGPGTVYGVNVTAQTGGSVFLVDSVSIGATPNYPNQVSNSSNITVVGPFPASLTVTPVPLYGARFEVGLTVSATSNAGATVFWD